MNKMTKRIKVKCKCGELKEEKSKHCQKCHSKGKGGNLSRQEAKSRAYLKSK